LVKAEREKYWFDKKQALQKARRYAQDNVISPNKLESYGISVKKVGLKRNIIELLSFPNIEWDQLAQIWPEMNEMSSVCREQIEIDAVYHGYIERQQADIEAFRKDQNLMIPDDFDYHAIGSLSNEVIQKLSQAQPTNLASASKVPGVTPAAVLSILRAVKASQAASKQTSEEAA
jgi:tRNA uridine 5-carboxymethylaminomethyl modification enzyme